MKQFRTILKFELKDFFTDKKFVGFTLILALIIAVVMFFPRFEGVFSSTEEPTPDITGNRPIMLVHSDVKKDATMVLKSFQSVFWGYEVVHFAGDAVDLEESVRSGKASCAFSVSGQDSYTYYVNDLSLYDGNTEIAGDAMRMYAMVKGGMTFEEAATILFGAYEQETVTLGKDQTNNFFYTYIMIMVLYMAILLYGQMVASNVATEKSSRAMELLVTSADPVSMMFGKVIASCLAGLTQLTVVFGTAFVSFNLNRAYWDEGGIVASIFDMPLELLLYMLLFFMLGFFIYAFMYGAIGSTVSKLEDIGTSVMPITIMFIAAFMVVMMALGSGEVNTPLVKACSFIPFTSPMAMFVRIVMSTVPWYEIMTSVVILIASVIAVGYFAAKIYRMGVLLYGNKPGFGNIIKMLRKK